MTVIPDQPCANPDCGCKVQETGQYCADSCRQNSSRRSTDGCQCGHSDCVVEKALRRVEGDDH